MGLHHANPQYNPQRGYQLVHLFSNSGFPTIQFLIIYSIIVLESGKTWRGCSSIIKSLLTLIGLSVGTSFILWSLSTTIPYISTSNGDVKTSFNPLCVDLKL